MSLEIENQPAFSKLFAELHRKVDPSLVVFPSRNASNLLCPQAILRQAAPFLWCSRRKTGLVLLNHGVKKSHTQSQVLNI